MARPTPRTAPPACLVCTGKDCRKARGHRELLAALDGVDMETVRCQDICKGPVAGVVVDGQLTWFRRLRKGRHRRALVALVDGEAATAPDVLVERVVRKRTGHLKGGQPGWGRPTTDL